MLKDNSESRRDTTGGARGFVMVTLSCLPNVWQNGHWIRERSDLRSAMGTGDNTGQCFRTLRAWRPEPSETMHARRVFVLHNMHTSLDFNSVDFLGMLEVLGLQLIFMHRGIWRDFLWWSYYCAFATVPLCLDDTVTVGHIDCMMCWCLLLCWLRPMYSSRHTKVNAVPH